MTTFDRQSWWLKLNEPFLKEFQNGKCCQAHGAQNHFFPYGFFADDLALIGVHDLNDARKWWDDHIKTAPRIAGRVLITAKAHFTS
jgi:hypothetical protein